MSKRKVEAAWTEISCDRLRQCGIVSHSRMPTGFTLATSYVMAGRVGLQRSVTAWRGAAEIRGAHVPRSAHEEERVAGPSVRRHILAQPYSFSVGMQTILMYLPIQCVTHVPLLCSRDINRVQMQHWPVPKPLNT